METISSSDSCPWKESLDPKQMLVSIHVLRIAWNSSPHWVDPICNQANRNIQMAWQFHGKIRSEVCHYAKLANKHKRQYRRQATAEKEREDHELAMRQLHKRIQHCQFNISFFQPTFMAKSMKQIFHYTVHKWVQSESQFLLSFFLLFLVHEPSRKYWSNTENIWEKDTWSCNPSFTYSIHSIWWEISEIQSLNSSLNEKTKPPPRHINPHSYFSIHSQYLKAAFARQLTATHHEWMHHRKQKKLAALRFLHQRPIGGGVTEGS